MRNQRMMVGSSPSEIYQGVEMRRRIAECRERLRRNRASRRIAQRATPQTDDLAAEVQELALATAGVGVREEET
jgi:hypothetical protein